MRLSNRQKIKDLYTYARACKWGLQTFPSTMQRLVFQWDRPEFWPASLPVLEQAWAPPPHDCASPCGCETQVELSLVPTTHVQPHAA